MPNKKERLGYVCGDSCLALHFIMSLGFYNNASQMCPKNLVSNNTTTLEKGLSLNRPIIQDLI